MASRLTPLSRHRTERHRARALARAYLDAVADHDALARLDLGVLVLLCAAGGTLVHWSPMPAHERRLLDLWCGREQAAERLRGFLETFGEPVELRGWRFRLDPDGELTWDRPNPANFDVEDN